MECATPFKLATSSVDESVLIMSQPTYRFMCAVMEMDLESVERAIRGGANMYELHGGYSVLHYCAHKRKCGFIIEYLVREKGMSPDIPCSPYDVTPLHVSADSMRIGTMQTLLELNANARALVRDSRRTFMHFAVERCIPDTLNSRIFLSFVRWFVQRFPADAEFVFRHRDSLGQCCMDLLLRAPYHPHTHELDDLIRSLS
jgi:hypothetical protein